MQEAPEVEACHRELIDMRTVNCQLHTLQGLAQKSCLLLRDGLLDLIF